ncbi:MAG: ribose 5-phosphate isomerase B [Candidatus Pacebacteria bacterium]|jgi:ribose 5-phosphate isomerase B|nr:ribose 5-phosphate isomerase B [Candidatus Paceibacterota bacterium]MDD4994512.1 ribose 5-phosphate isomerase B [Candidatus Paceibacterota bacterium]MDD5535287.1 ribose 5-phosphate isomerase B [Candidatus Paceibacterota bacterium]
MLYIGADHRGYNLKEEIKKFLKEEKIEFNDLGNLNHDQNDDYPDFAKEVALKVSSSERDKGILICGSGIGMSIAANKIKGIRAGLCLSGYMAKEAKQSANINILCLSADLTDPATAKTIVRNWLEADFKKEERYLRRIEKINQLSSLTKEN